MPSLMIDKVTIEVPEGTMLIDAARQAGVDIPTLCYLEGVQRIGACRVCLVEDEKRGRILASCVTPVSQEMVILTDTPAVRRYRRDVVRLMMANHPESCILCNQGNRCGLRQIAADLGVGP